MHRSPAARRLAAAVSVFAAAVTVVVAAPPAGDAAITGGAPVVHGPEPAPGALTLAGTTTVSARLWSDAEITASRLVVDGTEVVAERSPQAADGGATLAARLDVDAGEHVAVVSFDDAGGRHSERTWRFTATDRTTRRLAGSGRIETAIEVSRATFPSDGDAAGAVIARADDFADALAGAPFAVAVDGPLLLSHRDALPEQTAAELRRVLEPDATVHLLGGRAALTDAVVDAIAELGFDTARHSGPDRFATAAAVAAQLPPASEVIVASGGAFPDALAASAPAARDGAPILLTEVGALPSVTVDAVGALDPQLITVVGGPAVVSEEVERELAAHAPSVRRVAGPDRFATAAAVLDTYYDAPTAVSLVSGVAFPDALSGTRHAAEVGQPLVLTTPMVLPNASRDALRDLRPDHLDVYGGRAAVGDTVLGAAVRAAHDGSGAPTVEWTSPVTDATVAHLPTVSIRLDRDVDPTTSSVYLDVGGTEVPGTVRHGATADTLVFEVLDGEPDRPFDAAHPASVVVAARGADGRAVHHESTFTYLEPDPHYADVGGVPLYLASRDVQLIGFHESNHDGAQQQAPRDTATRMLTMATRYRGTGSRTSADVVANPDLEVLAPVTGTVKRAGSYVLYCDHTDNYAVIEPDARPGWEVKVLHFRGLRVRAGDRVVANSTVLGDGPRVLPFHSQVDDHSDDRNWPHVHVEVVDPSIPDRGGGGC